MARCRHWRPKPGTAGAADDDGHRTERAQVCPLCPTRRPDHRSRPRRILCRERGRAAVNVVASALTNSLQFKSAATTTSIEVTEAGGTATITSEGVTSFDTAAATQVVHIVSGNEHIVENVVSDGPMIYVHLDGGIIAKVVPGKSWLSIPSGQSAATSLTGGGGASNEAATLKVLSATGNDVSDLGSSRAAGKTSICIRYI